MKEPENAVKNLLIAGDGFDRLLMLFDIIIETDTVETMLMKDVVRVNVVCNFYGIKLSDNEKQLLIDHLTKNRQERRKKILLKTDFIERREVFVSELEKACN